MSPHPSPSAGERGEVGESQYFDRARNESSFQFPVTDLRLQALVGKMFGQAMHQIDRAMLAAGAADGDGQIGAVLALETRQPFFQKTAYLVEHLLHLIVF